MIELSKGNNESFENSFEGSRTDFIDYGLAMYGVMWSYSGWEALAIVTEEVKDPEKTFPYSTYISSALVTICYLLVNIAYYSVMSPQEIIASPAVAITFAARTLGKFAWIVPVGVAVSTFGAANGGVLIQPRFANVSARHGHLPKVFSYISTKFQTPIIATMIYVTMAMIFMIPDTSSFSTLLDYFSFVSWLFITTAQLAVIVFRFREPFKSMHRPFRVPIIFPIIMVIFGTFLVIAPLTKELDIGHGIVLAIISSGLLVYLLVKHLKLSWLKNFMKILTLYLQLNLELAPIEKED